MYIKREGSFKQPLLSLSLAFTASYKAQRAVDVLSLLFYN